MGPCETEADAASFAAAGVDRLIVVPWRRSSEAIAALTDFAARFDLSRLTGSLNHVQL